MALLPLAPLHVTLSILSGLVCAFLVAFCSILPIFPLALPRLLARILHFPAIQCLACIVHLLFPAICC